MGLDRLIDALQDTTARNLEQSEKQLSFEQERHGDAMQLARERLLPETRQHESRDRDARKEDRNRGEAFGYGGSCHVYILAGAILACHCRESCLNIRLGY